MPYACNSWRCPTCARHEAAVTFARIKEAFGPLPAHECVFLVLTIDREGTLGPQRWRDATSAYKAISKLTEKLLKRLRRLHATKGWECFGSRWVGTVEAHRSGWPHLNLVIHSPELAQHLRREQSKLKPKAREKYGKDWKRHVCRLRGELRRHVRESGWGAVGTAEPARSKDALAGYITKLAANADKAWAEVAKLTQLPLNAPERFRRLRSGKRFLPPRHSNPETTGALVRCERNAQTGDVEVRGMNIAADCASEVVTIQTAELRIIEALEDARAGPFAVDVPHALSFTDPGRVRERLKFTPKLILAPPAFCR